MLGRRSKGHHSSSRRCRVLFVTDLHASDVTFRKAIEADNERNMKAIPRKQRAMVRKGIQNGLTVNGITAPIFALAPQSDAERY